MNLKAALLVTAMAGVLSLIAACGGSSVDGAGVSTPSQPGISGSGTPAQSQPVGNGTVGSGTPAQSQPAGTGNFGSSTTLKYVAIDLNCSACGSAGGSGIGDGVQVGIARFSGSRHYVMWRGTASSMVDLGAISEAGEVIATSGGIQVGWHGNDKYDHAVKWAGSATSGEDIHPGGVLRESKAFGIAGDQIIGYGLSEYYIPVPYFHALLWTSAGLMDLNPGGFADSVGLGTDGRQQVGYGARSDAIGPIIGYHALLWSGTADSAVDLHPASGYDTTSANAVSGGQQVGWGAVPSSIASPGWRHALLWMGSPESVVDLHPSGLRDSEALAVAQDRQVGWGTSIDGSTHAL